MLEDFVTCHKQRLEGENLRVGFDCARGATRGGQRLQLTVNVQFRGWGLK